MKKSTLQRMLQLSDIKPVIKEGRMNLSNFELVKESVNGNTYAIVRENRKYHIKQAETKQNLTESDFDYIGGIANKMKKSFGSFSEATRHLNLMFEEINNHYDTGHINLLEDGGSLNEKKFVLKLDKKKAKKTKEEPAEDEFDFGGEEGDTGFGDEKGGEEEAGFGGEEGDTEEGGEEETGFGGEEGDTEEDEFDFGGEEGDTEEDEFDFGGEEGDTEEGGDEDLELDDSEDDIKDIQSTTGKLGQQLRDVEDISSDMQKWVAKSVLSALDLDNMDSDDKKDIIRTIKKKSEKETDETEDEEMSFGGEEDTEDGEEFDFGGEEEMEESYDNYMDDEDDFDGMDKYLSPAQERRKRYFDKEDEESEWESEEEWDDNEFPSRAELTMRDIDMDIQDKGYLNLDDPTVSNPYDSYMKDSFNERSFESFMDEMEEAGMTRSKYDSYMEDRVKDEDNPNIGGDEDDENLLLDFDLEGDIDSDELDALYGPNSTGKYSRSSYDRAGRVANKDISRHYHRPAAPGYDDKPVEDWASHILPYDTKFMDEGRHLREDHLNDEMETYEQERAYEDVEAFVRRYGMDVELCHKESNEDPEESIVYLDIVDGKKKLLKVRINSVGSIEVGEMRGKNFIGEPVDSVEDFIEIFGEDLTNKEREDLDMDITMAPQPQRAPEKQPNEPATKPGRPERKSPSERPSRRPFTPPPTITPGEEPGPKAGIRRRR